MTLSLPPPRNWQDFEDLCCDLWSKLLRDPNAQKNGRGGEPQNGVDLYGRQGLEWVGVQCKHKDRLVDGKLAFATIKEEVEKAKNFKPSLSMYVIATTAVRDVKLQEAVRYLDEEGRRVGSFSVVVFFWEDVVLKLCDFPDLAQKYYPYAFPRSGMASGITADLFGLFESHGIKPKESQPEVYENIQLHLLEVLNWSRVVQFDGMSEGEETDDGTIALELDTIPRRFQGKVGGISKKIRDSVLLEERKHYVLLGSPGSGKTTTLKRLARTVLLSAANAGGWQYPVLVRLANFDVKLSLWRMIADAIGIPYEGRLAKEQNDREEGSLHRNEIFEYVVSATPLDIIIPRILDSTGAIVLLDGLDEVPLDRRDFLERDIEILALRLGSSKIILTCRSGDYNRPFANFSLVEICPLELTQVEEICSQWLEKPREFLAALSALPYYDLAMRPLFLCHLIVDFRNSGSLPDQPADVYRKMVRLSLEKWDKERRISRPSRYSRFDPDRKLDFLAALAYHLTYSTKTKIFSTKILLRVYSVICDDFGLPPSEAEQVAQEIETHTGLILETRGNFEFSHLSLQEFLCAYYLLREPFADFLLNYLQEYPSPIAVAVSLAVNPSNWFAGLILAKHGRQNLNERTLPTFLSRLVQEQPHFSRSEILGFSLISIMFEYFELTHQYIQFLMTSVAVQDSVLSALTYYRVYMERDGVIFRLVEAFVSKFDLRLPDNGILPIRFFDRFLSMFDLHAEQVSLGGQTLLLFRRRSGELI